MNIQKTKILLTLPKYFVAALDAYGEATKDGYKSPRDSGDRSRMRLCVDMLEEALKSQERIPAIRKALEIRMKERELEAAKEKIERAKHGEF